MSIKLRNIDKLTRWDAFQLIADALVFADAAKDSDTGLYATALGFLKEDFKAYDNALVQEKNSNSAKELADADEKRDYAIKKLYALVKEYDDYLFDKDKEAAAQAILKIFKPYGTGAEIAAMTQNSETAKLTNLLQDLERETTQAQIQTLGFDRLVAYLKEHNALFAQAKQLQTEEKAKSISGLVKSTRMVAQKSFRTFCATVNALVIVESGVKYEKLVGQINTLVDSYLHKSKQGQKKKNTETPAEDENNAPKDA